jgi:hypothetical protein
VIRYISSQAHPRRMTTEPRGSNTGGLVQKLLFPAYTASGASDAFAQPAAAVEPVAPALSEAETEVHDNRRRTVVAANTTTTTAAMRLVVDPDPALSEADTEVHDNRSAPSSAARLRPPQARIPTAAKATTTTAQVLPPLFATTKPVAPPTSPPKLRRPRPFTQGERSLSNVALAGSTGSLPPLLLDNVSLLPPLEAKNSQSSPPVAVETTSLIDHAVAAAALDDSEHKESSNPADAAVVVWEEEATPTQTAFAKHVLEVSLQHQQQAKHKKSDNHKDDGADDAESEISSTASQMGTVIGASQLEDLDRELLLPETPTTTTTTTSSPHSPEEVTVASKAAAGTSFLLEEPPHSLPTALLPDHLDTHTTKKAEQQGLSTEASARLSRAIRRIGSGLTRGPVRSAPTTPRAAAPLPPESSLVLLTSPGLTTTPTHGGPHHHHKSSSATPSSFLLRSPGSAAFCAARTSVGSSNSTRNNPLLSPRFSATRRPPPIDEQGPSLPDLRTTTASSNPLQMARACFSFDIDTSMDDRYDVPIEFKRSGRSNSSRHHHHHKSKKRSSRAIQESQSWDGRWTDNVSTAATVPLNFAAAFREPMLREEGRQNSRGAVVPQQSPPPAAAKDIVVPTTLDVEREDALDLLACLVERGTLLDVAPPEEDDEEEENDLLDKVREQLSETQGKALERLTKSHEYALEMSRASQSAASWLKSIGRSVHENDRQATTTEMITTEEQSQGKIDFVTVRALWHASQRELNTKTSQMEVLNHELAKCRAEIGRLKTMSAQQQQQPHVPFQSPNRSILDNQDDDDDEEEDEDTLAVEPDDGYLDRSFPDQSANLFVDSGELARYKEALDEANRRIAELHGGSKSSKDDDSIKTAAPTVAVEQKVKPLSPGNKTERLINVHMLDAENFETDWSDLVPSLPPPPDHGLRSPIVQTVLEAWTPDTNLHEALMLWIENILGGASPHDIPPLAISNLDHQVRDGLTMHVLPLLLRRADIRVDVQTRAQRRTTYDLAVSVEASQSSLLELPRRRHWENLSARSEAGVSVTHSSVTALADNVASKAPMAADPDPPVAASDPVFPYPLRRDEILRSHTGFSYDEMNEDLTAAGGQHQAGLMSALGDALGGLMLRRPSPRELPSPAGAVVGSHLPEAERYRSALVDGERSATTTTATTATSSTTTPVETTADTDPKVTAAVTASSAPVPDPEDEPAEEEPYHRVVSAPPGRIGVTFVEYRGHAMVSKVATDSPLAGWMFESDILIAIDELPVSGMPVRDIIGLLRERVDNQRALRIISCHAMDEFTSYLNTSQVGEPTG